MYNKIKQKLIISIAFLLLIWGICEKFCISLHIHERKTENEREARYVYVQYMLRKLEYCKLKCILITKYLNEEIKIRSKWNNC